MLFTPNKKLNPYIQVDPSFEPELFPSIFVCFQVVDGRPQIYMSTLDKAFTFDFAFGARSTQQGRTDRTVSELFQDVHWYHGQSYHRRRF